MPSESATELHTDESASSSSTLARGLDLEFLGEFVELLADGAFE